MKYNDTSINISHIGQYRVDVFYGIQHKYIQFYKSKEKLFSRLADLDNSNYRVWVFLVISGDSLSRLKRPFR